MKAEVWTFPDMSALVDQSGASVWNRGTGAAINQLPAPSASFPFTLMFLFFILALEGRYMAVSKSRMLNSFAESTVLLKNMSSTQSGCGASKQSTGTRNPPQTETNALTSGMYKCAFCNGSFQNKDSSRKHFFLRHLKELVDEQRKEESPKRDEYWNNQQQQQQPTLIQSEDEELGIYDALGRYRSFGRRRLSKDEANILEEYFECSVYLKKEDIPRLLTRCDLPYNMVRNWFNNTRQKVKHVLWKKAAGLDEVIRLYPKQQENYECIICHITFKRFLHLLMHLHAEKHKATYKSSLALSDKGKYTRTAPSQSDEQGCSKLNNSPTSESKETGEDTLSVESSNKYCPLPNFVQMKWRMYN
ncbi:Zinc finger homeobox protein 4 [Trichinella papuae]|uniref:Zinc finger homeobox protein 4 n=1 Tax=Trichinella papuae TaxID=268474 RepID=A0A0V1M6E1_9BILA|nr:Zinc finger homeobox protein 4 [Trichinella papuae]